MARWMAALMVLVAASSATAGHLEYAQTFDVQEGAWLEIDCPAGSVTIDDWDQAKVEVVALHDAEVEVRARQERGDVQVGSVGEKERKSFVEYELRVPAWINVNVLGNEVAVDIRGVMGEIDAETVDGEIYVRGGRTRIGLRSVKGDIELDGAEGKMDLEATNGSVTVIGCQGDLLVESINGDIRCENVVSTMVEASTLNGDILFDGALSDEGDYYFTTHNGDIDINVPRDVNVAVTVVTYRGEFDTDFDLHVLQRNPRLGVEQRRWSFDVGQATATLHAESFQGDIEVFSSKRGRGKRG